MCATAVRILGQLAPREFLCVIGVHRKQLMEVPEFVTREFLPENPVTDVLCNWESNFQMIKMCVYGIIILGPKELLKDITAGNGFNPCSEWQVHCMGHKKHANSDDIPWEGRSTQIHHNSFVSPLYANADGFLPIFRRNVIRIRMVFLSKCPVQCTR